MDCRLKIILYMAIFLTVLVAYIEGRTKKVVIHVPFKVKKIKHTHTVYKTIHHHHAMHETLAEGGSSGDQHEHFHHMHIHEEAAGAHSQPSPGLSIPEFLPDVPLEMGIDMPDLPQMPLSSRHVVPLYRKA